MYRIYLRRLLFAVLFVLLAPSAVLAQPSLPFPAVAARDANLRAGPGTTYARVGGVTGGQALQVIDCNTGCTWYKLDTGAWIAASLVKPAANTGAAQPAPQATTAASQPGAGQATANAVGNLRSGPGTTYSRVGSTKLGQTLTLTGRNAAGDWYQLADGTWIAAFLVNQPPTDLPVAGVATQQTAVAEPPAAPPPAPQSEPAPAQQQGGAEIVIDYVYYDGQVRQVESDEYVQIANKGDGPANLGGWTINAGDPGQNFTFPSVDLGPGQTVRVYTNETHPESGGYSYGHRQAIWNNKGDCGILYDAGGNEIDNYCY